MYGVKKCVAPSKNINVIKINNCENLNEQGE